MTLPVWGTIGPRGALHCHDEEGNEWLWARCHKDGCLNCVSRHLSNIWCWPHLDGSLTGDEFIDAMKKETVK